MPKRTNQFQQLVYAIHLQLVDSATVTESKFLRDRMTGDEREVDIVIETGIGPYRPIIGAECRGCGRRADIGWVEEMYAKHQNLTNKLVLVSESGFTTRAIRKAKTLGIEPLTLTQAKIVDWSLVVGKLARVYIALSQIGLTHIGIYPSLGSSRVNVSSLLYNHEGKSQSSLLEIALAALEAQQVTEYIFRVFDKPGTYAFSLNYTPPGGSCIIDEATIAHKVELLWFYVAVHMDERTPVELQHISFEDAQVAYGTLKRVDLQGLLTIVEARDRPLSADLFINSEHEGEKTDS